MDTMTKIEAESIIQKEADSMQLSFNETMNFMQRNMREFGSVEKCAFNVIFRSRPDMHFTAEMFK